VPQEYEIKKVIMRDPQYYGNLSSIITSTPREVLHAYFQWQIINVWGGRLYNELNKPLRVLSNQLAGLDDHSEPERWRTCINEIDANLGWILSGFYIDRVFGQEAKDYGDRIIRDIKAVFAENLKALDWMSDAVKERAAKKG
jgi:endothelin-converting enzyme